MISKNQMKLIRSLELKKNRKREGLFVAEGPKVVGDLLQAGYRARMLFSTTERPDAELITEEELHKISFLQHPQEVLAVFEIPASHQSTLTSRLSLALDGIQDPGNLGTIIRIADWFGISGVFASEDSVDLFNPKVVQSTMGAIFRVPFHYADLPALADRIRSRGGAVYGTFLNGNNLYDRPLSNGEDTPSLVITGNESNGISPALAAKVSDRLYIPPFPPDDPGSESLNAAVATAVTIAEFRRRTH